jgi:hypothetical protein
VVGIGVVQMRRPLGSVVISHVTAKESLRVGSEAVFYGSQRLPIVTGRMTFASFLYPNRLKATGCHIDASHASATAPGQAAAPVPHAKLRRCC